MCFVASDCQRNHAKDRDRMEHKLEDWAALATLDFTMSPSQEPFRPLLQYQEIQILQFQMSSRR